MRVAELDTTVIEYINEIKINYEQQITNYEQQITELKHTYETQIQETEYKYLELKERFDLLLHKQYGRSSEKTSGDDGKQPLLFSSQTETAETALHTTEEELSEVRSHTRKKPGRKALSAALPRKERIIDIPEDEKVCSCGAELTRIGEETSETLQVIPQQIYVEKIVRPKYACRCCEGTAEEGKGAVRIAPVEPSIIPRSIASPSLLSTTLTYKFERHLPYYRQEKMYEDIGAGISRQDMSNWQQQVYEKLSPLFSLLKEKVKSGPVLQMDETTVQVMGEEGRSDTQKSYMWLALGGPPGKKVIWYEYHPTRAAKHVKEFLQGYSGYLQTDGYAAYDCAVRGMPDIIQVGCFAHARREFFNASKVNKETLSAEEGLKHIRKLYQIEEELRKAGLDDTEFLAQRKARAGPVLEKFKEWLLKRQGRTAKTLLLGKAIHYSLAQWDKMTAYLESPYLTPDNNACENAIRPFVIGRKNWLFSQSPEGAESSCGMYTLIGTAKQNGLVPFTYLMALFEKAPSAVSPGDWENLLPWNIFTA